MAGLLATGAVLSPARGLLARKARGNRQLAGRELCQLVAGGLGVGMAGAEYPVTVGEQLPAEFLGLGVLSLVGRKPGQDGP